MRPIGLIVIFCIVFAFMMPVSYDHSKSGTGSCICSLEVCKLGGATFQLSNDLKGVCLFPSATVYFIVSFTVKGFDIGYYVSSFVEDLDRPPISA